MATIEAVEGTVAEEPTPAERPQGVRMVVLFYVAFAVAGMSLGLRRLHDNSFLWHLQTGKYILDHGIPYHDPYSFSAYGSKWVAQSWLAELTYGVLDRSIGAFGIRLFDAAVGACIATLLFYVAWKCSRDRLRAFLLAGLSLIVMLQVWTERPLLIGLLAMLVVVVIVEVPSSFVARHVRVSLPLTMWIWANVHGTFSIGFGFLALHLIGRWLEGAPPLRGRERDITIGTAIASAAVFLNPYGIDLVLFPIRLMGRGQVLAHVEEWQSPNFRDLGGMFFGLLIVVTLIVFARKSPGKRDLLVSIVFLLLGLWAVRNVGLAAIVVLPVLARLVRPERERKNADGRNPLNRIALLALFFVGIFFVVWACGQPNFDLKRYPVAAYDNLQQRHLDGQRLLTTDAWGGYLIADAWPTQHVFYDDRYDMYPLAVTAAYDKLAGLGAGWQKTLDDYKIDVVMWPNGGPILQGLALDSNWQQIYTDKVATVYVRKSLLRS